jgi:hypothetical protein
MPTEEQTLQGAVLAVRAVQDGEDHIDGGQALEHLAGFRFARGVNIGVRWIGQDVRAA